MSPKYLDERILSRNTSLSLCTHQSQPPAQIASCEYHSLACQERCHVSISISAPVRADMRPIPPQLWALPIPAPFCPTTGLPTSLLTLQRNLVMQLQIGDMPPVPVDYAYRFGEYSASMIWAATYERFLLTCEVDSRGLGIRFDRQPIGRIMLPDIPLDSWCVYISAGTTRPDYGQLHIVRNGLKQDVYLRCSDRTLANISRGRARPPGLEPWEGWDEGKLTSLIDDIVERAIPHLTRAGLAG
jgi:hypothetical protein